MIDIKQVRDDPAAFDKHYFEVHSPLAKKMPGLVRCEIERVKGTPVPGTDTPYLAAHLYFKDMPALQAAMKSDEGKAAAKDLMGFAGKYVRMFFTEVVEA